MKIVILDGYASNPGDLSWEWLGQYGEYVVYDRTESCDIAARCAGATAVLTNKDILGEELFAALPDLRYVGVLATGYNNIDIAAAKAHGITVTNIPAYSTASVAQCVFAHLLNIVNQTGHYASQPERWAACADFSYADTPLTELAGKTMGIVGLGRTGQATAAIAQAFGLQVIAYTSKPQEALPSGIKKVDLNQLFNASDMVSLHCPLTLDTHHLINAERLSQMKPTAILINTSRGPVVDEQALADALNEGRLRAAGVDVLSSEPPRADNPLLHARNCFITPHIAWATREARERLMDICQQNIAAFAAGKPINVVS